MSADRMIQMIFRMALRPLINRGMNAAIDKVMGKGKAPEDMTPEERQQAKAAKDTAKRARQMARATRRMGRF